MGITAALAAGPRHPARTANRRSWTGLGLAGSGLAGLTAILVQVRADTTLASVTLLFLLPVVLAAVMGGLWPALATALAADLIVNFYFVPPVHNFTVERGNNVLVLTVYIVVAVTVAVAVDVAARQRATAARRALEVTLLARSTADPVTEDSLELLLGRIRDTFALTTVALLERDDGQGEQVVTQLGEAPHGEPSITTSTTGGLRILGWGPDLFAEDRRVLDQLAQAAARTLEAQRLAAQAAQARELAEIDRLRTALLTAVGHDLRTPLAGIKAAVSSLRQADVEFAPEEEAELLATIEESTDALGALVENLLAMSRLQTGVLSVHPQPVPLDAVVAQALLHTPTRTAIEVDVRDDLPLALADPGLLERVLGNLLVNAETATPVGRPIEVRARVDGDRLLLQVVDHGPGIPAADHDRIFAPFQRLNDHGGGLGLGLALARGFTAAMSATLTPTETPGGGLTMTVSLPLATGPALR
jgi:K+-sensing histidine kinase KdpD